MVASICACVAFYEHMLLVLYIKWIVYIINEQIPKNKSTISTYRDLYLELIECLNDINRTIYGLPGIVNFIAANVGTNLFVLFYKFIFSRNPIFEDIHLTFIDIITFISRSVNIILFYGIGHATTKEVFIILMYIIIITS